MGAIQTMTDVQWEVTFKPIKNHLDSNASLDGCMFETFGEELEFVRSQPASNIWTYVDDGANGWLVNGYHLVNRLGYVITEQPFTGDWMEVTLFSEDDFETIDDE